MPNIPKVTANPQIGHFYRVNGVHKSAGETGDTSHLNPSFTSSAFRICIREVSLIALPAVTERRRLAR
jgi:hypothetical protein